jgi:Flp pilus assembly protein TadG
MHISDLDWADLKRFSQNASGTVAIVFAAAIVPIFLAVGVAVDLSGVVRTRDALNAIADSSALAAVEFAAQQYQVNNSGWSAAGVAAGQRSFAAGQLPVGTALAGGAPTVNVAMNGQVITATVSYNATIRTNLMQIARINTIQVSNTTTTSVTVAKYTDLHVVIDNSASMGMAASAADETILQTNLGTTCFLGCHINSYPGSDTVASYRAAGATLRIDVVKSAVVSSLTSLRNSTGSGTVRVALYTFNNTLAQVFPLSSNISAAISAVNAIDLATDGGGTNISYSLNSLNAVLPIPGSGKNATAPKGAVLLFTDGVQDHEQFHTATGWTNDPNWVPYSPSVYNQWDYQPIDPGACAPIKAKGYSFLVLNAQYVITSTDLAEQSRYGDIQNVVLPAVPPNVEACSSGSGHFYSANSPAEITTAVTSMFSSATNRVARLTN